MFSHYFGHLATAEVETRKEGPWTEESCILQATLSGSRWHRLSARCLYSRYNQRAQMMKSPRGRVATKQIFLSVRYSSVRRYSAVFLPSVVSLGAIAATMLQGSLCVVGWVNIIHNRSLALFISIFYCLMTRRNMGRPIIDGIFHCQKIHAKLNRERTTAS